MPDPAVLSLEDLRTRLADVEQAIARRGEVEPDRPHILYRERRLLASAIHYAQEAAQRTNGPDIIARQFKRVCDERDAAVARAERAESECDVRGAGIRVLDDARLAAESLLDRARAVLPLDEIDVLRRYHRGQGVDGSVFQEARTAGWRAVLDLADLLTPTTKEGGDA